MSEKEWISEVSLLSFLVIVLSLRDGVCNRTEPYAQYGSASRQPGQPKQPKLLIFNLDQVIWPFRVDRDVVSPVKKNRRTGAVNDFVMKGLGVFSDAVDALNTLYLKQFRMGIVSDSADVQTNTKLLLYFNLYNYFPIQEIFCGPKRQHLEVIHRTTTVPYEDILYFDVRNDQLDDIRKLGVHVVVVEDGLAIQDFDKAMDLFNSVSPKHNS